MESENAMRDSDFLSLIPQDSNPACVGVDTLQIAHSLIGRALIERGYISQPSSGFRLKETIEFLISKGYHVVPIGVAEPLPYRVQPIEIYRKKLTEPLHPKIYPVSGDRCAKCKRNVFPQFIDNAIIHIPTIPGDFPEQTVKFLAKVKEWEMKNICAKCSSRLQKKYKNGFEILMETNAEFMARIARDYPWIFEFDDSLSQQLPLAGITIRKSLPAARL